jgi:N-acylneuraminate cytidylyltransferase
MSKHPSCIALIPARSGSSRVKDKNIRHLNGHPLIAYSIASAIGSAAFDAVMVSTNSPGYAAIAEQYGAEVPFLRPEALAGASTPDIEWVTHTLDALAERGRHYDCFSILRPTSPFRLPSTIRRAWAQFQSAEAADSLRAVEKCSQHPGKMWVLRGKYMLPLLPIGPADPPWHSSAYQSLPEVYVQNASLEIAWSRVVYESRGISGNLIVPFVTEGNEGFDINTENDFLMAELLLSRGEVELTPLHRSIDTVA